MRLFLVALLALCASAVADDAPAASFTEELRKDAGSLWVKATSHPFTAALASGEMDSVTMARYLIEE